MMKILLFCNKGFETMEFAPFVDIFGWAENDYHHDLKVRTERAEVVKIAMGFGN